MKILLAALLLFASSAFAEGSDFVITKPESWTAYDGTRIIQPRVDYDSKWECMESWPLDKQHRCVGSITGIRKPPVAPDPEIPVEPEPEVPVEPEPETPQPEQPTSWVKCADEFTWCHFTGNKTVRYGASNTWVYKTFQGGAQCQNSTMAGYDPLPGVPKACYIGGDAPDGPSPTNPDVEPNPEPNSPVEPPDGPPPHTGHNLMPKINNALIPPAVAGFDTLRIKPTSQQPVGSPHDNGAFRVWCDFSHMNYDDAILYPGQQGRAHLHTYFGNTDVDYRTVAEGLDKRGNSTCNGGIMNRSAYWIPAMIDTLLDMPLKPRNVLVYYKHGKAQVIPKGLKMIAGNMHSDGPQDMVWYECNEQYASRSRFIPDCGRGGLISMSVTFMDCWDGRNLDSSDHASHMRYSTNGVCPASHPRRIPTINVIAYYNIQSNGTRSWRLSSDNYTTDKRGGFSGHADFIMGWDETLHKVLVDNCINTARDCHAHLTGDGREYY